MTPEQRNQLLEDIDRLNALLGPGFLLDHPISVCWARVRAHLLSMITESITSHYDPEPESEMEFEIEFSPEFDVDFLPEDA